MKNSLFLALAVASLSLAGCADDAAETDTVTVEPAPAVTEPADDMMMEDSTMMGDDAMMEDSTMMEGGTTEGGATTDTSTTGAGM
jgi:hypothetical protein